jgi:hypothetical protein
LTDLTNGFIQLLAEKEKWHNGVPVMKATKKMPKTSRIASRNISACRLNAGSSRVEPVPPYIQWEWWVSFFESKRQINPFLHSAPYTFAPFRGKRSNQSSFVERSLSAVAVQRESLKPDM